MAHATLTAVERVGDFRVLDGWDKNYGVTAYRDMLKYGTLETVNQEVERLSRGKRHTQVWRELQQGVIMPSDFKAVLEGLMKLEVTDWVQVNEDEDGSFLTLPIFDRNPPQMTPVLQWQIEHEEIALHKYYKETWAQRGSSFEMGNPGIIISKENPLIGASPHGIVYTQHESDPKPVVAVIVKCIHPTQAMHPKDAEMAVCVQQKNGKLRLKKTHEWYYEAQATMGVLGIDRCDIVMYTTGGICVKRIPAQEVFIKRINNRVDHFLHGYMFPFLYFYHDSESESSDSEAN